MSKTYLDTTGLMRLWAKIKALFSPLDERTKWTPNAPTLNTVNGTTTGYRLESGVWTANSIGVFKSATLEELGLAVGDTLKVSARQSYNTSVYAWVVGFWDTTDDLAEGDECLSYAAFSHAGQWAELGECVIPEGTVRITISHNRNASATYRNQYMEVRKVWNIDDKVTDIAENDLLADYLTRYTTTSRRYLVASTGEIYGSNYGTAGVYYTIDDFIDVRHVKRLAYKLQYANATNAALLAAYDKDKKYIQSASILSNSVDVTREGIWERPEEVCYVRFTICTSRERFYCYDPDRLESIERGIATLDEQIDDKVGTQDLIDVKKEILPSESGGLSIFGATSTTKLSMSTTGLIESQSGAAYVVYWLSRKFHKGDVFRIDYRLAAARAYRVGYTKTDPSTLGTLVGVQTNIITNITFAAGEGSYDSVIPEDEVWLFIYMYNQDWDRRNWTLFAANSDKRTEIGSTGAVTKAETASAAGFIGALPIKVQEGKRYRVTVKNMDCAAFWNFGICTASGMVSSTRVDGVWILSNLTFDTGEDFSFTFRATANQASQGKYIGFRTGNVTDACSIDDFIVEEIDDLKSVASRTMNVWSGSLEQNDTLTFPTGCYGALRIINSDDGDGGGAVIRDLLVDVPNTVLEEASCYPSTAVSDSISIDANGHTVTIEDGTAVWQFTGNLPPTSSAASASLLSMGSLQSIGDVTLGLDGMSTNEIEPLEGDMI